MASVHRHGGVECLRVNCLLVPDEGSTEIPQYGIGTPKYEEYAAELRAELGKWIRLEPPYDNPDASVPPQPKGFYFTFGRDHLGGMGFNRYVFVPGDVNESRTKMLVRFGRNWAYQYAWPDDVKIGDRVVRGAGVKKYNLTEIDFETGKDKTENLVGVDAVEEWRRSGATMPTVGEWDNLVASRDQWRNQAEFVHFESGWYWQACEQCPSGHIFVNPGESREPLYRRVSRP